MLQWGGSGGQSLSAFRLKIFSLSISAMLLWTRLVGEADHFIAVLQAKRSVTSAGRNLVAALNVALNLGKFFVFGAKCLSTFDLDAMLDFRFGCNAYILVQNHSPAAQAEFEF